ncbi:hypothetical protein FRD01_03610 [Microvenator marinus]|uniref:Uncharacterized protein n=1 Tax=Microvenator marinus TaxID=2600177 RepID=A0A5B8XKL8_9DELT|nr:hypothetical protein [Microvenator marinus]QED26350.1 hypothetical protein FRD01_03610 [Microvenator marinus]
MNKLLLLLLLSFATFGCKDNEPPRANAQRVTDRNQLVGGPTALGDIGDYVLENDKIKVVIQDLTYNRGSGLFGGSLIDADLKRYDSEGNPLGGNGRDTFGELFPVFFLEMIDPQEISIINDGTDGKAAIIEVKGKGGEFVTMLRYLNQLMLNSYAVELPDLIGGVPANSDGEPQIEFSTRYILEPGARHIRIDSTMRNISQESLEFPPSTITGLLSGFGLDLSGLRIPTGHVLGFGALSSIFVPGVGYDLRFGLDEAYQTAVPLPGFPGLLTNIVASTTDLGVNYGFITVEDPENNFVYQRDQDGLYDGRAAADDFLFLFYASGFGGVFSSQAPQWLKPTECSASNTNECEDDYFCRTSYEACLARCESEDGQCSDACTTALETCKEPATSYTFTNYFVIGDGDVASIYEELYKVRGVQTQKVRGRVRDATTGVPVGALASVLFYSTDDSSCSNPQLLNQVHTRSSGFFELELLPGRYCYRTRADGHPLSDYQFIEVNEATGLINARLASAGEVLVHVTDESGMPMPAKLTLVGVHEYNASSDYKTFLFDLEAGEPWLPTDLVPDDPNDPNTRKFMQEMAYGDASGKIRILAPPGKYTAYISRGAEYDLATFEVDLKPAKVETKAVTLKRVVDTTGYLSGDFHLHAAGSIDSGLDNNVRVRSVAGEGIEIAVSTDHNYVTDYRPFIQRNQLDPWLTSVIGLELTTFEAGHFNAFPVNRELDSQSRGSIKWQDVPPQKIFDTLREMAPEGGNIIQVNHPRTPILGYFAQHNVDAFDSTVDLAINQATGTDRLTATLTSPTGPAFIEEIQQPNGTSSIYRSTFSWEFDAIEVFNGKHLEELRHFRMPFDKTAAAGTPDALPPSVFDSFRAVLTEDSLAETTESGYSRSFLREFFPDDTNTELDARTAAEVEPLVDAWTLENIPEQHTVLCDGDDVVFAGGLDDYYNILNHNRPDGTYRYYAATGNSDVHGARSDEAGIPRNYTFVGHDDPQKFNPQQLVDGLRARHNIVTNGPFINLSINDNPVGSEFSATGELEFEVLVRAADWVGADRFRIVANGEVLRGVPGQSDDYWGWTPVTLSNGEFKATFTANVAQDTWFVLEVEGDNNLFPVVTPQDIPPFNFDAVIGSLAGAFGFGGGVEGLEPNFVFPVTPFAFTNPIWVVTDGDGAFTAPNPPIFRCQDGAYVQGLTLTADKMQRIRPAQVPIELHHHNPLPRQRGSVTPDLRMLFESFGHIH